MVADFFFLLRSNAGNQKTKLSIAKSNVAETNDPGRQCNDTHRIGVENNQTGGKNVGVLNLRNNQHCWQRECY
jgi:hypothetical protein